MAKMEYRLSESSYVGQANNGTWVRVDESEFAECVRDSIKSEGINSDDEQAYQSRYDYWRDYWLSADEWAPLIGQNDNVTEA